MASALPCRRSSASGRARKNWRRNTFDPDAQQADPDGFGGPGQPAKPAAGPVVQQALGIAAIPLTAQIARQLGASEDTKGVVITAVDDSADAAAKGLQRGDIVLSANYKASGHGGRSGSGGPSGQD